MSRAPHSCRWNSALLPRSPRSGCYTRQSRKRQHQQTGTEPTRARPQRWTVLFVWGRKRVYPIRITGMTINETSHNTELNPVRAEIEVAAEVLSEADARDNVAVSSASSSPPATAANWRRLLRPDREPELEHSTPLGSQLWRSTRRAATPPCRWCLCVPVWRAIRTAGATRYPAPSERLCGDTGRGRPPGSAGGALLS